jgi:hypothetical protein
MDTVILVEIKNGATCYYCALCGTELQVSLQKLSMDTGLLLHHPPHNLSGENVLCPMIGRIIQKPQIVAKVL